MTRRPTIYLDYAAATPVNAQVLAAMLPYFTTDFYNPSSSYLAGRAMQQVIEAARAKVAGWLGARSAEIIFTAGATEANNLAIHGIMQRYEGANILVASTEHEAVLAPAREYAHQLLPVSAKGQVDVSQLQQLIDDQTVLISVSIANNETGVMQPLTEIAEVVKNVRRQRVAAHNDLPLYLHTDAAQAAVYLDVHTARLGVDLMTLNGGKMYGPKQTGVLFAGSQVVLQPQVRGGKQERGIRSGTQNVAGIVGFAAALDIAQQQRKAESKRQQALRDILQRELLTIFPDAVINGDEKKRLGGFLNISFPGIDGERLLMMADEKGLQIATGAACSANRETTGSHVLRAMGLDETIVGGSIRLTVGTPTTTQDIQEALTILPPLIQELR